MTETMRAIEITKAGGPEVLQPTDRPKGRQGLAPKSETVDVQKVAAIDFGRGMARQGKGQIIRRDPVTVVRNTDQGLAPVGDCHLNPRGPRVQRVFNQFLDRGRGTFDHLTGGNPVDGRLIQLTNNGAICAYFGCWRVHTTRISTQRGDSATAFRAVRVWETGRVGPLD